MGPSWEVGNATPLGGSVTGYAIYGIRAAVTVAVGKHCGPLPLSRTFGDVQTFLA
jgi:hypothetical protein